jgi:hypothetical protein
MTNRTPILPLSIISTSFPGIALMDYKKKGDEELNLVKDDALRVFKRYNHWSYVGSSRLQLLVRYPLVVLLRQSKKMAETEDGCLYVLIPFVANELIHTTFTVLVHRQGFADASDANKRYTPGTQPIHVPGRREQCGPSLTNVIRLPTITNQVHIRLRDLIR